MNDPFWNVKEQERREVESLRMQIDAIERTENMGRRALALRHSPGFTEFVQAVKDVHQHVTRQVVSSDLTDTRIRELRGKAQALNDVLALFEKTDQSLEILATNKVALQNALLEAERRRPKPKPAEAQA